MTTVAEVEVEEEGRKERNEIQMKKLQLSVCERRPYIPGP
jgi:hypothetical protein